MGKQLTARKKFSKAQRHKLKTMLAGEPTATGPVDRVWMIRAYTWYGSSFAHKDQLKWLFDHLKTKKASNKQIEAIKVLPFYDVSPAACCIARMLDRGIAIPQTSIDFLNDHVRKLVDRGRSIVNERVETRAQKRTEFTNDVIGAIEGLIDDDVDSIAVDDVIANFNGKLVDRKGVRAHFVRQVNELAKAINKTDSDVVEGYSHYSTKQLKRAYNRLKSVCQQLEATRSRVVRKKRAPKAKTPEQLCKHIAGKTVTKYRTYEGVDCKKIIGARQVIVVDVPTRTCRVFVASDKDVGLSVDRTSIVNFDVEQSIEKRIGRNFDQMIDTIVSKPRVQAYKVVAAFNTQTKKIRTGRLGKNTLILRVDK